MIKVTPKTKSVLLDIPKHKLKHKKQISDSLHEIGQITVNENQRILRTGRRTGRIYRIRGRDHVASAAGEPPALITGRLAKSAGYKASGWTELRVGQQAPYAAFLENGTRFIRPRVNLLLAVNNTSGTAVRILNDGRHIA